MLTANMTLLYVNNPLISAAWWAERVNAQIVEKQPTFAMAILPGGAKLGFWSRHTALPAPAFNGASTELAFTVSSRDEVDALYRDWGITHQVTALQAPVELDFGYTCTLQDPDGHRVRICCLNQA